MRRNGACWEGNLKDTYGLLPPDISKFTGMVAEGG